MGSISRQTNCENFIAEFGNDIVEMFRKDLEEEDIDIDDYCPYVGFSDLWGSVHLYGSIAQTPIMFDNFSFDLGSFSSDEEVVDFLVKTFEISKDEATTRAKKASLIG